MKTKNITLAIVLCIFGLSIVGFEYTQAAKEKQFAPPKIGIVSIREVFENCAMKDEVEKALTADGEKKINELKSIEQEIANDKAALEKRKPGSDDYLNLLQSIMLKQSSFETKQEFFQQAIVFKEIQGKEKIYGKIIEVISKIAQDRGLGMVVSRDDNYLNMPEVVPPPQNPSDFIMTTKTHKLLYYNKSLDITAEVLEAMGK
ncbi:MAG: OmpH family outer membrane protein [Anaerohalosphaeraceae bacterium]|nr:OmpH family outer membrane protein [Anaerohalosphaeraceae bacterium]